VLPGDSLLFTIGVVAGAGQLNLAHYAAAHLRVPRGRLVCNLLGRPRRAGIFNRPDSRFFKQEHLQRTHAFYEKHGGKTIILIQVRAIIADFASVCGRRRQDALTRRFLSFDVFVRPAGSFRDDPGLWLGGVGLVRPHFGNSYC